MASAEARLKKVEQEIADIRQSLVPKEELPVGTIVSLSGGIFSGTSNPIAVRLSSMWIGLFRHLGVSGVVWPSGSGSPEEISKPVWLLIHKDGSGNGYTTLSHLLEHKASASRGRPTYKVIGKADFNV